MVPSPIIHCWIHPHEYRDSMVLMYLSSQLEQLPGVARAMAIMGTDANKELLSTVGLRSELLPSAGPNDLVVAIQAEDEAAAGRAAERLQLLMSQRIASAETGDSFLHSIESAVQALPDANLALISIPGRHAAREAHRAMEAGLNVFLFSDNVSLSQEVELKREASERGLLLMGPDCGTAIAGGAALGFANVVRRGNIGIVGASGTGIQEVTSLLDAAGLGISHALGTGGRDLSAEVGASTTLQAIDLLDTDPATEVIVLISKPPAPEVAARVLARAARCNKSVVACLLGSQGSLATSDQLHAAATLEEAARIAASLAGAKSERWPEFTEELLAQAARERSSLSIGQRHVRGLFSGGTLCEEAMLVWRESLGPVWSNVPLDSNLTLPDPHTSREHTAVDLGDDLFTSGRPHPMIDPSTRCERLLAEAADPTVAVIVLDVVLGYGSHEDMAGALVPAIVEARRRAEAAGRYLAVVAHVCGTEADPQALSAQQASLRDAGVLLAPSNAAAARLAAYVATGEREDASPLPMGEGRVRASAPSAEGTEYALTERHAGNALTLALSHRERGLIASPHVQRHESAPSSEPTALLAGVRAVNVGLELFYRSLRAQQIPTVHVDWRPPAGGDTRLAGLLDRLNGRRPR